MSGQDSMDIIKANQERKDWVFPHDITQCLEAEATIKELRTRNAELEKKVEDAERALRIESNEPEERTQEAAHYNWLEDKNEELQTRLSTLEKEKKELTEKYSCCGGKTSCANNQLRCFCDEIFALYEKDKDEAKERLGVVIETLETDRDLAICARKETHEKLPTLLKASEGMEKALEGMMPWCEDQESYGVARVALADFRAVKEKL